jgi:hypothetical protein
MLLRFEKAEKRARLPETAYGLSRYAMDEVLLHSVVDRGARLIREHGEVGEGITVIATGRTSSAVKGNRLFGFKAHFSGPVNDVMELYFLGRHSYVGVSAIEAGLTNVCGLAPENELVRYGFDIGAFLDAHAPIRERLQPLRQQWKWLNVGPLVFENRLSRESEVGRYFAGDALSFVDPFTGSGILSAVYTGSLAGRRAAGESGVAEYTKEAGKVLRAGLLGARTIRLSIKCGLAPALLPFIPSQLLFHATRPHPAVI